VELIRRIRTWTPANLGAAFVVASFGSGYLVALLTILWEGFYDPWWDFLLYVFIGPLLGAMILGFVMAAGLGIFAVGPTWLLRLHYSRGWMWLVAAAWGGLSAQAFLVVIPLDSDSRQPMIPSETLAFAGTVCGLVWWMLARRVLRRDAGVAAEDESSLAEEFV